MAQREDCVRVEVLVPVPEGKDTELYAERVEEWSLSTLQEGSIESTRPVGRRLGSVLDEEHYCGTALRLMHSEERKVCPSCLEEVGP